MRLILASRKSDLARLQAYMVGQALSRHHPHLEISYQFRSSLGDQNQHDPLWKMPERGVFTEDFLADLIAGRTDLVVHSWKDLPVQEREETMIAATLPRADARDLLLFRRDHWDKVRNTGELTVLSSSPRRAYNLAPFLQTALPCEIRKVNFTNVRGNVPTRIAKLLTGEADALVLAKAALDRLLSAPQEEFEATRGQLREDLSKCLWMVLPLSLNPTAAAQGALAVEIRRDREDLMELFQPWHCPQTFADVQAERDLLSHYGGGCHQKIGITRLTRPYGSLLMARGAPDEGEPFHRVELVRLPSKRPPSIRAWPEKPENFFAREALTAARPSGDLFVARSEALPESWQVPFEQLVWTAGVKTWQKLARRQVWVHGTQDGLGEREPASLETLLDRSPKWNKLTHEDAPVHGDGKKVATYKLRPLDGVQAPSGYTHYFWMSGTQFDRAVQLDPDILKAHHACGPGHTYEHLRERLGPGHVEVYLSFENWQQEIVHGNTR